MKMHFLLGLIFAAPLVTAAFNNRLHDLRASRRADQLNHADTLRQGAPVEQTRNHVHVKRNASSPFLNSKSKKFYVNGKTIPDINFDVGESYAGNLPISTHRNESRELYFWFFPSIDQQAADKEILIWLQGGPGSSSLFGLAVENGPFSLQPGEVVPTPNTFAWTNLTNVVWIDQPVGTGFSVGTPNITNDYQLADQFMGFWKNFVDTFAMQGYKVYFTGESYAGYYIPYIANGFIDANDTKYFNFAGAAINDPIIGNSVLQFENPAFDYLNTWNSVFGLDAKTYANISAQNTKCGYDKYNEKYLTFPAQQSPFPGPFGNADFDGDLPADCDVQGSIASAATNLNPCFNEDHVIDTCPFPYFGLGPFFADFNPPGPTPFFNRPDVAKAIHAPANVTWESSAANNVYVGANFVWEAAYGDESLPPAQIDIVTKLIEHTNNILVGVGGYDFQLAANGSLLVFQNMTWHGTQGFSKYPSNVLYVPNHPLVNNNSQSGFGDMGSWVEERGFTFFLSKFAGHEGPWYTPGVYYRVIQKLLGRIPDLSNTADF